MQVGSNNGEERSWAIRRALLAVAVIFALGAAVGLDFGLGDLHGEHVGPALRVTLGAPPGTSASQVALASDVVQERLSGQRLSTEAASTTGTRIVLRVAGTFPENSSNGALTRDQLVAMLTAPDHLEEREVLEVTPAASSTDRLTACSATGTTAPCPPPAGVECASASAPGCADPDLAGREVTEVSADGEDVFRLGPVLVPGSDIASARATLPPPAAVADVRVPQWQIIFRLTSAATPRFAKVTRDLVGKRLAIVVDRVVVSAPEIQQAITTGESVITGRFTARQARDLATALGAGELPMPLSAEAVEDVPAHDVPGHVGVALLVGFASLLGLLVVGGLLLLRRREPDRVVSDRA